MQVYPTTNSVEAQEEGCIAALENFGGPRRPCEHVDPEIESRCVNFPTGKRPTKHAFSNEKTEQAKRARSMLYVAVA
jgi:hypothetical protein